MVLPTVKTKAAENVNPKLLIIYGKPKSGKTTLMAALEDKIATLEADFSKYASDFVKLNELTQEKEAVEQQLEEKMERWVYLHDLNDKIQQMTSKS